MFNRLKQFGSLVGSLRVRSIMGRASILAVVPLALAACESGNNNNNNGGAANELAPEDEMFPPLTDRDSLFDGAPDNSELPLEGKFDAVYPPKFDLIADQSPMRNQARRGVCSIFSTVGLMESLYIKEGTIKEPDFSEQFLQWSVKEEVGAFKTTGGSNASSNLEAIHRYGIVEESVSPYEPSGWTTSNDERCTGDDRPTVCYTNGTPSDEALAAPRFKLPRGRYVNSRVKSIKAVMTEKKVGVIAGMDFFYQSWNHGGSTLPTNRDHFSEGYVLYPNDADKAKSLEKRAGHSILLVGWDDELEVEVMDENGKAMLDEAGNPVTEKGFWLFKNSWGTGGFGLRNPHGVGYGWLSYRYVEEYANTYTSDVPTLDLVENCTDGKDNTFNQLVDCLDPSCGENDACREKGTVFANTTEMPIPDGKSSISSEIAVDLNATVDEVRVKVNIEHGYIGDLTVSLVAPSGKKATLHDRKGGGDDNLVKTFTVADLEGVLSGGTWTLQVKDGASGDAGRLIEWSLELKLSGELPPEICDDGIDNDGVGGVDCADAACAGAEACSAADTIFVESTTVVAIPDNDPAGVLSTLTIEDTGVIQSFTVAVDITHPYRADLRVTLLGPDGTLVTLFNQDGDDADNLVTTFDVAQLIGASVAGTYTLEVADLGNLDDGTLNSWSIEAVVAE